MRPIDRHPLFSRETVVIEQLLMPATVFVHEPGHFHVEAAIFCNLEEAASMPFVGGAKAASSRLQIIAAST